ncbi:hypothetical protein J4G37_12775 [Microvirga sp. 3-52]|nr:hypothetical protein [Microvirga sp. 3-52]
MGRWTLILAVISTSLVAASTEAEAQVYGSFVDSCTRIEQRGPFLRALCQDQYGRLVPTRLDLRNCASGQAANRNGRLVCEGGDYGRYRRDDYGDEYYRPSPRPSYRPPDRYYSPY